jgi:G3E family GTPase
MSLLDDNATATPVSVITGFLGSGKTTLLNHLLSHPDMEQTAVLINEFGEIGLDHLLVKELDDNVVLLKSGCICCTVQGELVDGLKELYMKRLAGTIPSFRRIAIETTGLADPLAIISCLMRDPLFKHVYQLDGLITTVDAVYGDAQLDEHEEAVNQAAVADRLLITKTDLADTPTTARLHQRLRMLNPGATVIPALFGKVEPGVLFDTGFFDAATKSLHVQRWLNDAAYRADGQEQQAHVHDHGDTDVNRHDKHISTFCLTIDEPIAWGAFKQWYEDLAQKRGDHVLRVKGIVNIQGENQPLAIHCVRSTQHVPERLPAWPDNDRRSRIVFITRDLVREEIEHSLHECVQTTAGGHAPVVSDQRPRERWLNDAELSRLFAALVDESNTPMANALRLMLLVGTGVKDVLSAHWGQFDLARGTWTRPGTVLGKSVPKKVQLGEAALALLEAMRMQSSRDSDYLFGNASADALDQMEAVWKRATRAASIDHADLSALRPVFAKRLFEGLAAPVTYRLLGLAAAVGRAEGSNVSGSQDANKR